MYVILKKNGFIKKEWDYEKREHNEISMPFDLEFFKYWRSTIEIVEPVALENIVNIIKNADEDVITLFQMLIQCNFSAFVDEVEKDFKPDKDLNAIVIKRHTSVKEYKKHKDIDFTDNFICSGRYTNPRQDKHSDHVDFYCALDFTPWYKLKHLPLVIDKNTNITYYDKNYNLVNEIEAETDISVSDFFCALFDELCFFGSPGRRDGEMEELKKRAKEVEDGTAELIPWEEVIEKLEKKIESREQDEEESGTD